MPKNEGNKTDPKRRNLRSQDWFDNPEAPDQTAIYLERYQNYGWTLEELQSGRPVIGIAQTGSDLSPCNRHHLELARRIREGIRDAGGVAMEFPVHPLFEQGKRPTAALDRNLAFLGLVEILYGYPLDGVVLTTGCDKTTPAGIMAACAVDMPAIVFSGGPMLNGWEGNERIGSGTIIWRCREQYAAGEIDYARFMQRLTHSATSVGHCNTMGTALTMNCIAEALGMSLPGCAAIPGPYMERAQMAYLTGRRIVDMVREDLRPGKIITREAIINAIKVTSAIGGSSNAPVHVQAIARQLPGVDCAISDWQTHGEKIPLLVNCQPAGDYLGEDFYRAGGVPAVFNELHRAGLVNGNTLTVTGKTMAENCHGRTSGNPEVIRSVEAPLKPQGGFAVLSGNLFESALMKKSVIGADFRQKYLSHPDHPNCFTSRAVVFEGSEDYHRRINDPALDIDERCMLVIRNCGPIAYPGSAEVVNMLPPDQLVKQGITALPCMGDGRQSGTSASPSILNASPEAAVGGGLSLLQTGDLIEVDLNNNTVNVLLSDAELSRRKKEVRPAPPVNQTPWQEIYRKTAGQLQDGAAMELDELHQQIIARHGTPRHSH